MMQMMIKTKTFDKYKIIYLSKVYFTSNFYVGCK